MRLRKFLSVLAVTLLLASILLMCVAVGLYIYAERNTDSELDEALFLSGKNTTLTRLYYSASDVSYVAKEYSALSPNTEKKEWTDINEISENVRNAFIAAEDREFYSHPGFNFKRTVYALFNTVFHVTDKFGASTITQQVIKNISGDKQQTFSRKLNEIIRAIKIEKRHTKDEILELYLNIVPMGYNISGVGLASEYYFGKSPSELSFSEGATLAGITNAPAKYNPYDNPSDCLKKRNNILYAMLECGFINEDEYQKSKSEPLDLKEKQPLAPSVNSWFVDTVCDDVCSDLSSKLSISNDAARLLLNNGGLSIYTTVKPEVQASLENYFEDLNNFPSEVSEGLDYSMIITDSHTGYVVGVVGNVGKKTKNRILNHTEVPHIPGSTLKPIALYAPLLDGGKINWASVFDDVPVKVTEDGENTTVYPRNSPDVYDGLINVTNALRVSKNTVAVRLYELLGKERIFNILTKDYGFDTIERGKKLANGTTVTDLDVSPLALGQLSYGVPLRRLTEAYSVLSSYGELKPAKTYLSVYDSKGNLLLSNDRMGKKIISDSTAKIMNMLLRRVVDTGTAKRITLKEIIDTAGKTGTSGSDKDRLFVGYTPYYTAGIWCGYDGENRSIGSLSVSHLEIWDRVMHDVHKYVLSEVTEREGFNVDGLLYLPYCRDSGEMYSQSCLFDMRSSRLEYGYFTAENKPLGICSVHVSKLCDPITKKPVKVGETVENPIIISFLDIEKRDLPPEIKVLDSEYILPSLEEPKGQEGENEENIIFIKKWIYNLKKIRRKKTT